MSSVIHTAASSKKGWIIQTEKIMWQLPLQYPAHWYLPSVLWCTGSARESAEIVIIAFHLNQFHAVTLNWLTHNAVVLRKELHCHFRYSRNFRSFMELRYSMLHSQPAITDPCFRSYFFKVYFNIILPFSQSMKPCVISC